MDFGLEHDNSSSSEDYVKPKRQRTNDSSAYRNRTPPPDLQQTEIENPANEEHVDVVGYFAPYLQDSNKYEYEYLASLIDKSGLDLLAVSEDEVPSTWRGLARLLTEKLSWRLAKSKSGRLLALPDMQNQAVVGIINATIGKALGRGSFGGVFELHVQGQRWVRLDEKDQVSLTETSEQVPPTEEGLERDGEGRDDSESNELAEEARSNAEGENEILETDPTKMLAPDKSAEAQVEGESTGSDEEAMEVVEMTDDEESSAAKLAFKRVPLHPADAFKVVERESLERFERALTSQIKVAMDKIFSVPIQKCRRYRFAKQMIVLSWNLVRQVVYSAPNKVVNSWTLRSRLFRKIKERFKDADEDLAEDVSRLFYVQYSNLVSYMAGYYWNHTTNDPRLLLLYEEALIDFHRQSASVKQFLKAECEKWAIEEEFTDALFEQGLCEFPSTFPDDDREVAQVKPLWKWIAFDNQQAELCLVSALHRYSLRDFIVKSLAEPFKSTKLTNTVNRAMLFLLKQVRRVHSLGFIHRDINPTNILLELDADEEPQSIYEFALCLADYSVLRHVHEIEATGASFTVGSALTSGLGHAHYIAPEMLWNSSGYSNKVDVYALGLVYYEMLFGSNADFAQLRRNDQMVLPPLFTRWYARESKIIQEMISTNAERRFSVTDVHECVKRVMEEREGNLSGVDVTVDDLHCIRLVKKEANAGLLFKLNSECISVALDLAVSREVLLRKMDEVLLEADKWIPIP